MKKIVVTVPVVAADRVRQAIGEVGGGKMGNYTFCSFSVRGVGRFVPGPLAHPSVGEIGKPEVVEEDRIEMNCADELVEKVVAAIRAIHPYEEPFIDICTIE